MGSETVSKTAESLGVPIGTLHTWLHKAKQQGVTRMKSADGSLSTVNTTELVNENKVLKARVQRLEQEKAILKKAATYFAKELG